MLSAVHRGFFPKPPTKCWSHPESTRNLRGWRSVSKLWRVLVTAVFLFLFSFLSLIILSSSMAVSASPPVGILLVTCSARLNDSNDDLWIKITIDNDKTTKRKIHKAKSSERFTPCFSQLLDDFKVMKLNIPVCKSSVPESKMARHKQDARGRDECNKHYEGTMSMTNSKQNTNNK